MCLWRHISVEDRWLTRKTWQLHRIFCVTVEEVEGSQNNMQTAMFWGLAWKRKGREPSKTENMPMWAYFQSSMGWGRWHEGWGEEGVEHDNHALCVFDVMGKRPNTTNTPQRRVCCVRREGWVRWGDVEAKGWGVGVGASRVEGEREGRQWVANQHLKRDFGSCFRCWGGKGGNKHAKHAHMGMFWVFDVWGRVGTQYHSNSREFVQFVWPDSNWKGQFWSDHSEPSLTNFWPISDRNQS